ncbi:hypothetical protein IMZ48_29965 [Candidatus Bathyarchaeota archaeon]|nr:hypothetical protein [Candidatus Bathyarchaeota archaeon]
MAAMYKAHRYLTVHSITIDSFTPSVCEALLNHPPPGTANIAIHHAHGLATEPNLNAAFPIRRRHLVLLIQGDARVGVDPAEKEAAFAWAADLHRELRSRGVALNQGCWSFTAPEFCDASFFFGEERVRRLKVLKERYNPGDAFPLAYPVLGGF